MTKERQRMGSAAKMLEADIRAVRAYGQAAAEAADDAYVAATDGSDAYTAELAADAAVQAILADIEARHTLLVAAIELKEAACSAARL